MGFIRQFVSRHDASDLWWEAQQRHVAFGEVQSIRQVAQNPQFAHRGFFQNVAGIEPSFAVPARSVRYGATPSAPPRPPAATQTAVDDVVTAWQRGEMAAASPTSGAVSWPDASAKPLAGLRIADFTWVLAGPFATRIMGDLGADVVKFQNEERASVVNKDDYPYFAVWNRSKRSATLNMKHTGALAVVRKIIEKSDVLIENYAAGVLDRWGLDYATVKSWNPRIIYVSMSGCGHDGPWTKVISYAPTVHALCGLTSLTNPAGRGDVGAGFSLNDHAAGFAAVLAVLAAVEARERTGVGQQIDMAQLEVGAYLLGPAFVDLAANDHEARAAGNIDGVADHVPNEIYRCADEEFLAVTARSDAEWASLCAAVGLTALADDPELRSEAGRILRRVEIDAAMSTWARSVDAEAGAAILQGVGVPAGRVQNAADLAETDPQLAARGFWLQAETHLFGTRTHDRFPAKFSASALEPYEPSPYLGQHSFDVYGELAGMSDEEIAEGLGDGLFA